MTDAREASFGTAWAIADGVPGWMTERQGRALWRAARLVPAGGRIVEIGSHQGRSTVILATAAGHGRARVTAIDPFIDGRLFGGPATRAKFEATIDQAGLGDVVELIAERSTAVRPGWQEPIGLLYIDGKHDYWTVRDDLRWAEHLVPGAGLLVHDSFSSIGVTLALLLHVQPGRQLRYLGRTGSLARFERAAPSTADRWRLVGELPWFVRNVIIKIGLRFARLVGYRGTPDPY